jgi:hypothetical protein
LLGRVLRSATRRQWHARVDPCILSGFSERYGCTATWLAWTGIRWSGSQPHRRHGRMAGFGEGIRTRRLVSLQSQGAKVRVRCKL